jgi:hypothetical protein
MAKETISRGVRSRAIGLPVRSLERLLQLYISRFGGDCRL